MTLSLLTGRNHLLPDALNRFCARVAGGGDDTLMVVVPKQLTLETELALLDGLRLAGSFRLRVLSPERLCAHIFDAAGYPEGARVDERGRVMLVARAAKRLEGELTLYRGAQSRRGFAQRAARQLEAFRQAGLDAADVALLAGGERGALSGKLNDLSLMLAAYEGELAGRFQDGEDELRRAAERAGQAGFLQGARLCFYGFDLMPPTLHGLIAAVAEVAEVSVFLPLESDPRARDYDLFRPLAASAERLVRMARERNVRVCRERVEGPDARAEELVWLGRELFAYPARPWTGRVRALQLFAARTLREEARFAAALTRRLVRTRGWRFSDVRVLVPSADAYRQALGEAFAACEIPIFLSESRPLARHALAECLLTALSVIARGPREEDIYALLASGYLDLSARDADRLRNYAVSYGLRARAFFQPLVRGPAALVEALEPVRARAMAPLAALRDRLRASGNLRAQLEAVFAFLTDIRAYEKGLERQRALVEAGFYEEAGGEAQVWNRVLGALDQMAALMGEERLRVREIADRLREALEAAVVKPLPQSGDAVQGQEAGRLSMRPVKAVLLLGQVERAASGQDALLSDRQLEAVSLRAGRYLGLTPSEAARTRLFYAAAGLEMATDYVCVSYPLAGADDAAERPGPVIQRLGQIFPGLDARGGVRADERVERLLLEAPGAALARVAAALSRECLTGAEAHALRALARFAPARKRLEALLEALDLRRAADRLSTDAARRIYGEMRLASVSRLELFAACPFAHFMRYGLKPEIIQPYALTPRDEGTFFHAALHSFMREVINAGEMAPERAEDAMERVAEALLAPLREGPLGQSAVSLAEERRLRGMARTAARLLVEQLGDSRFVPVGLEMRFGPEDGDACLRVGGGGNCTLYGAIDRVDAWEDEGAERFVRVMDYKRGDQPFSLARAWEGLQLQLPVYLAAAAKKCAGLPAGAFYFRVDEGYVNTSQTDPEAVAELRRKELRMDGALLAGGRAREALSEQPRRFYKAGAPLEREALARLLDRALEMAGAHADAICAGTALPSPVHASRTSACRFCDWKSACLFDEGVDRARVRRVCEDKDAVLQKLRSEP